MNNRVENSKIAIDTLNIIEQGFYITDAGNEIIIKEKVKLMVEGTKLIILNDLKLVEVKESSVAKLKLQVVNGTTVNEVIKIRNINPDKVITVLNFASAKNPGGGFLKGSTAQEESLARASSMYKSLITKKSEFYDYHTKLSSPLYSDRIIYSPNVLMLKDDKGTSLNFPIEFNLITSPAVNAKVAISRGETVQRINKVMEKRIEKIIEVFICNESDILVLGAFGCGVFGNAPKEVARIFNKVLKNRQSDLINKEVYFVILDRADNELIHIFEQEFKVKSR